MKKMKLVALVAILVAASAFTISSTKQIDIKTSSIKWTGTKVLGSHNGTINLSKGYLEMEDGELTGGMFVVDMSSITVTDLKAGEGKEKLEGHLKSDDFFGTANHPTATLVITTTEANDEGYLVTADLTIKGITKSIEFDMEVDENIATANVTIDRTQFGVRYGSGSFFDNLGDKTISDDFELEVSLQF